MIAYNERPSDVYFLPLFFHENSWVHELDDESYTDILVKVSVSPSGLITGVLRIDEADVFTLADRIPPAPKLKILKAVIQLAVQKRTGFRASADNAHIIFADEVITTNNTTEHNNYNN